MPTDNSHMNMRVVKMIIMMMMMSVMRMIREERF